MTEKDIVRLAIEAELWLHTDRKYEAVEKFAKLVAAAEREACIRDCDSVDLAGADDCITAIRARGQGCYTAPPQREWQGLTLDEIYDSTHGFTRIQKDDWVATDTDIAEFAHIIEARLKAKNT